MAQALGQQTGTVASPAYARLRAKTEAAVKARFEVAALHFDREQAQRASQLVADFGLPAKLGADFSKRATNMPRIGSVLPEGGVLKATTAGAVAVSLSPVTRADYARFVHATRRTPALCREKASLLRVLAPRDWKTPGFIQNEAEAVVCVSLQDAEAYAGWYSQQTGQRWRLPTADEVKESAARTGKRAVSLWSRDCAAGCVYRVASGKSWRTSSARRPLLANRGYDDVGFRLVRDLQ
jgi:serine/threonine-protein kinase PpkA